MGEVASIVHLRDREQNFDSCPSESGLHLEAVGCQVEVRMPHESLPQVVVALKFLLVVRNEKQ